MYFSSIGGNGDLNTVSYDVVYHQPTEDHKHRSQCATYDQKAKAFNSFSTLMPIGLFAQGWGTG